MSSNLTYEQIEKTAAEIARDYRKNHEVPELPKDEELTKYRDIIDGKFSEIAEKIEKQILLHETWAGHGYEHLRYVAILAAWLAEKEGGESEVVEMVMLAGLFHDIDRYLGFGENHMTEGEKTTRQMLESVNIEEKYKEIVCEVVRNHDHLDYKSANQMVNLVYGAVYDADHFRWGLEREDTFWTMKEKKGVLPEEVIHDYKFLPPLRNAWKTKYGKEVGPKLIDFGMTIAVGVEKKCG